MKILKTTAAALVAASIMLSGNTVANALPFSSGSSGPTSTPIPGVKVPDINVPDDKVPDDKVPDDETPDTSESNAETFLDEYKQLHRDKGYEIIEAPELTNGYAEKATNERDVTYLANGNGLFGDSFGHILEGYSPKVQRIKHYGHNIRFDRASTVVMPAEEGDRVALDIFSDDTYYYIVKISFTSFYQG